MHKPVSSREAYADQLVACTQAMVVADSAKVERFLSPAEGPKYVKLFAEGNFEKRLEKLQNGVYLLFEAREDLESFVREYIKTVPLPAYATGITDGEQFLNWFEKRVDLTPVERDVISCHHLRHQVELAGRENRLAHVQFQSLREESADKAVVLDEADWLWLNPAVAWGVFETTHFLGEDVEVPSKVVSYAFNNEVRTSVVSEVGERVLRTVGQNRGISVRELEAEGICEEIDELKEALSDFIEIGLVSIIK